MIYSKILDVLVCVFAFFFAVFLKHDSLLPVFKNERVFYIGIGSILVVQVLVIFFSGINKGIWRHVSILDAAKIIKISSFAAFISFFTTFLVTRLSHIHRSILIMDWVLLTTFLLLARVIVRFWCERNTNYVFEKGSDSIIIVGAGVSGNNLYRDILRNPHLGKVVGFVDDDPKKIGRELAGKPILGSVELIPELVDRYKVTKVFVAIPAASGELLEKIVEKSNLAGVILKTLPKVSDILKHKSEIDQLRTITPEDLLGREEIYLDQEPLKDFFYNKNVLVTGAGGSIGSEVCRQISAFCPRTIILFEQNEFNLYQIEMDLKSRFPSQHIISIIGDIRDRNSLYQVFESYRPSIVYHAAAYKHVPMVEKNPFEGVFTNVLGTMNVAEISGEFNVEQFVLISTDKAVNPTNIMGATKRVAEIIVQHIARLKPKTKFSIVRFGNVLGSSGSVIPLFKKQIENGGPITLTHELIERYFMSIPEATRLVLQASLLGKSGEIFVLDMGRPVKIIDLARKMITLAGLKEGRDIDINIVGLRPGEKLYEELLADKEETLTTPISKIRIAKAREVDKDKMALISNLLKLTKSDSVHIFRERIKMIVPEYNPVIVPENEQTKIAFPLMEKSCT